MSERQPLLQRQSSGSSSRQITLDSVAAFVEEQRQQSSQLILVGDTVSSGTGAVYRGGVNGHDLFWGEDDPSASVTPDTGAGGLLNARRGLHADPGGPCISGQYLPRSRTSILEETYSPQPRKQLKHNEGDDDTRYNDDEALSTVRRRHDVPPPINGNTTSSVAIVNSDLPLPEHQQKKNNNAALNRTSSSSSSQQELWLSKWLFRLKKYFLVVHLLYIIGFSIIGCALLLIMEHSSGNPISFIDALFTAVSCTTCTGLASVDVEKLTRFSTWLRHLLMVIGGCCFTSAIGPILRLIILRKLRRDVVITDRDSDRRKRWKQRKSAFIERLVVTSTIAIITTYVIWVLFQLIGFIVLKIFSNFPTEFLILRAIAAFQGCAFMSLIQENGYESFLIVFAILSAAGSPLFPVFLRFFFVLERNLFKLVIEKRLLSRLPALRSRLGSSVRERSNSVNTQDSSNFGCGRTSVRMSHNGDRDRDVAGHPLSLGGHSFGDRHHVGLGGHSYTRESHNAIPELENEGWDTLAKAGESKWLRGFNAILDSDNPVTYHHFLFVAGETRYLLVAWFLISFFQFIPYTFQQWDANGVLAQFDWFHKILLGFSQSVLTRYAGINFVDITRLYPAHIMIIIFAMYIPPVPIPNESRTRKKWNQMVRVGAWRLLTSRFWWLFVSILVIAFMEEDRLLDRIINTRFGILTRAIFEVLSAYATSGLSLSLGKDPFSFSGDCTVVSKIIIMLIMIAGRHRGMDLGIDIGLTDLEVKEREMRELEERMLAQIPEGTHGPQPPALSVAAGAQGVHPQDALPGVAVVGAPDDNTHRGGLHHRHPNQQQQQNMLDTSCCGTEETPGWLSYEASPRRTPAAEPVTPPPLGAAGGQREAEFSTPDHSEAVPAPAAGGGHQAHSYSTASSLPGVGVRQQLQLQCTEEDILKPQTNHQQQMQYAAPTTHGGGLHQRRPHPNTGTAVSSMSSQPQHHQNKEAATVTSTFLTPPQHEFHHQRQLTEEILEGRNGGGGLFSDGEDDDAAAAAATANTMTTLFPVAATSTTINGMAHRSSSTPSNSPPQLQSTTTNPKLSPSPSTNALGSTLPAAHQSTTSTDRGALLHPPPPHGSSISSIPEGSKQIGIST